MSRWFTVAIGLLLLFLAAPSWAEPQIPPLTGRVVDLADVLSPQQEQGLSDRLAAIETQTGIQIVVTSLNDLGQYPIETWGLALGRGWKIGRQGKDDGIVIVLAPADRQVRIEIGYGLEATVTDAVASRIIRNNMLPAARKGNYAGGLVATVDALAKILIDPSSANSVGRSANDKIVIGMMMAFAAGAFFLVLVYVFRNRQRTAEPSDSQSFSSISWSADRMSSSWGASRGGGFGGRGGSFGGGGASGRW